ncbi:amino acid adenylation domain-containing protein [Micromonospora sp. DSM 115977]|uniref:Phenyloxazoline synthase MbtB n=1 Tax=Micromonospora reichwaldensis TaxID=3075516 RepID=A0ABU2WQ06_9ACTN|nr:non-ribosomal peptide synthetase [Micromonospora sp. DSM 115977]MDT0528003.1 amino acid adenylation domain-containing protein [Micromonospora sp. DSM 115977]
MPDDKPTRVPAPGRVPPARTPAEVERLPDRSGLLPLSFAQRRLWFLERLGRVGHAYHMPLALQLDGRLDHDALRAALDALVARHEVLRTRIVPDGAEAAQRIDPPGAAFPLRLDDLTGHADAAAALARLQQEESTAPFDLAAGPLFRGRLVALAADRHVLLLTMHHIVSDGWSLGVLTRELGVLYTAHHHGQPDPLPPLPVQYADYAAWQRQWLTDGTLQRQENHWRHTLADAPTLLELPTDRPRPTEQDHHGAHLPVTLDPHLTTALKTLTTQHGGTLYMTLLTAWAIVLSRLSGHHDLIIGTPTANRRRAELENLIGFFVNTLALRIDLTDNPTTTQLLHRVRDLTLTTLDHQDLPFEHVVEAVNPTRNLAHTPLFQVMFAWQNNEDVDLDLPGVEVTALASPWTSAKFDLTLSLAEHDGRITGSLEYATALFDTATAERHIRYLRHVLTQLVAHPDQPIDQLTLLDPAERRELLAAWDDATAYPVGRTIPGLFAERVAAAPDAVAVTCEGTSLTYRDLDARANRLAHHLRAHGVGPDALVGVCLERSPELVVALLAVLKAGGAYVPLDPSHPAERLGELLRDSAPVAVLTHAATRATLDGLTDAPLVDLDADTHRWADRPTTDPDPGTRPDHLAYVIYTSGSTGRPKGVMVEHANVVRLFSATAGWFGFGPTDVWSLFHSFAFDFSVWEIWGALLHGGRLVIVPRLVSRSPADFHRLLCDEGVTVLNQTPSAFRSLIAAQADSARTHRLRTVVFGGEALDPTMLRPWYADARNGRTELVNMYGITETTVHVTHRPLTPADTERPGVSPIGGPIGDLRLYVLDGRGEPVPPGVVGELHVGGAGVARGYLNRPALTAERFRPSPFVAGDRLYATGDLVRHRPDGGLEYLGRNDSQVQIRGYRVELGEIEARLAACPGVRDAVVTVTTDATGEPRLVGYYTASVRRLTAEALRTRLAGVLPEHMVPAAYVRVAEWPLTPNGKLDHRALPAPDGSAFAARHYTEPVGPTETALAAIWAEVLGVERVGRHDNFFALGGHSLLALRVLERMRRQGLSADVRALFASPVLADLAAAVGARTDRADATPEPIPAGCDRITPDLLPLVELSQPEIDAVVATVSGGAPNVQDVYPLAPVQEGMLFHHLMARDRDPYLVTTVLRFADRDRLDRYAAALEAVVARHDVLRTGVVWHGISEPVQVVWRRAPLPVEEVTLDPAGDDPLRQLREHVDRRYARLPLDQAPLLRLLVARDPRDGAWLAVKLIHHIVDDNTSLKQLRAEVRAYLAGEGDRLPPPLPFRDFVARIRRGADRAEQESFFRRMLSDVDSPTVPFGLRDIHGDGHTMRDARVWLGPELARRLRQRAQALQVGVTSLFHVAWGQVLARAAGRRDVVFGTVLSGRMDAGAGSDRVLGPFLNTLPLRVTVDATGATECVLRTHEALTGLIRHEHASLALAQSCSGVAPPAPLFTALLNYRHAEVLAESDAPAPEPDADDLTYLAAQEHGNYPLALDVDDLGDDVVLTVAAAAGVAPDRVCAMVERALETLADALERAPDAPVGGLDVLPPAERRRLVEDGNDATVAYPPGRCVHHLVEARAARDPQAVALVLGDERLTYGELNTRANRLAHHLRARGVGPDRLVAICVERSLDTVVGLLAVLKAGGAYLPLDPAYPADRLAAMLHDSTPVTALTHGPARERLHAALAGLDTPVVDLDLDAAAWAALPVTDPAVDGLGAHHLAYVIYTSGTSGTANGVLVEHRQLMAVAAAWERLFDLRPGLVHLQMASFSFDVFTADVVRALGFGGRLVLCPRPLLLDSPGLYALLRRHDVDFADFVPAVLNPLLEHLESTGGSLAGLETVVCGSDAWTAANAAQLRALCGPRVRIVNAYGVTEAAVDSTCHLLPTDGLAGATCLPIGRPLPNVRVYLLDAVGEPVPDGVVGEIHIGGAGVARGYLNRPELTARRFRANPFVPGERLYRTGDLGRRLPGGELEFLGRDDFQVKVRGFRVELGEIESRLAATEGVREAVVVARPDAGGQQRLVAYVLGAEAPDAARLRDRLAAQLPEHMVPSAYVRLAVWPLTPNGKLDRAALPAPDGEAFGQRGHVEPVGLLESMVAGVWAEVLGVERVGRHDDFFALGGHSLLAMRLVSRIRQVLGREVSPAVLFAAPVLAAFVARLTPDGRDVLPPIRPVDRAGALEPSFAQRRLWFLERLGGLGHAYHMPLALELAGWLDHDALRAALDALVARHEALRTRLVPAGADVHQHVDPPGTGFTLRTHDLTGAPDAAARLARLQDEEFTAPFDLTTGPLIRGRLVTLAPDRHVLLVTMHHVVSDGWSIGVLTRELGVLYTAHHHGEPDPLPPLPVQYADYAAWQRQWLTDGTLQRQENHWRHTLTNAPTLLHLPTDRPRPTEQDHHGAHLPITLDPHLTTALKTLTTAHGTTLYMTLLTAWAIVLSRLTGQHDLIIGTPTANRRRAELENLIGFFVNTLALRIDLTDHPTTTQLLHRIRDLTLTTLDHQDLPFEHVVEAVNPTRNLAHTPLFQVMFAWQNTDDGELTLPGLRVTALPPPHSTAKFDLTLALTEHDGRITGSLEYATALFDTATAQRHIRYLRHVLTQLVAHPDQPIDRLTLLDEREREQALRQAEPSPVERGVVYRFAQRVAAAPDAVAVTFEGTSLTYRDLDARANRLAHHLRAHGVGPDTLVAVCLRRSPELIVALLAVARAGGAYLPLDPAHPAERLAHLLADGAPVAVLAHAATRATLDGLTDAPLVDLDADTHRWADHPTTSPDLGTRPDHLAYVIHTSGSTGRPKGVAQTWRCLDNLIDWQLRYAAPGSPAPQRVLQFASIGFDVSAQEIWSTLCQGGTLVLIGEESGRDLGRLRHVLAEQGVRRAFLPAAVLHQLAGLTGAVAPLEPGCEIVTAGEALRVNDDVRALVAGLGGRYLYNQYGPTETHVVSQFTLATEAAADWPALPPIGRPIANARLYVLDERCEPVPAGVLGELYIGGSGLARGYLNRPAATAARFLPDPFAGPGERMYRSGDLVRRRADGTIEFVGRADDQVKVRGFRVEPGEVEAALRHVPGVREAAVLLREDAPGDAHLVGYLVGDVTAEAAREQLRRRLPEHLVPTRWVVLERLPLTANGKLDRRALRAPEQADLATAYVAPRDDREARMAAIWAEVLRRDRVGAHDDFFALGGHSLLATRLVHAINERMSARLSLRTLFQKPVLADLAAELAGPDSPAVDALPSLVADPTGRYEPFPLTDIQEAYWVGRGSTIELGGVGAHGYSELRLRDFDEERFTRALHRLVDRHDMLRAVFHDGVQRVLPSVPRYAMARQDLRGLDPQTADRRLGETRERMSHQVFDAGRWPLFEFAVTLLDGEARLHVSLDALILDAASGQILEHELALLYADPDVDLPPLAVTFRDYVLAERALRRTPRYERALDYWRERVGTLAPAPQLPLERQPESVERPRFTRYDEVVPAERWSRLKALAGRHQVTPSVLLVTAFAQVLARWSRQSRFTLSLPLFNRLPLHPGINAVIGDFTSLVLLEVDVAAGVDFVTRARAVQEQLWQDIDHSAVSGVRVNRELARARGTRHAALPVVFNSTLTESAPDVGDSGLAAALGGEVLHGITQTPQVWIDHTVLEAGGRLHVNWDSIDELFPAGLVAEMFAAYRELLGRLAEPDAWYGTLDGPLAPPVPVAPPTGRGLLHELVDRQALATPAAPAVLAPDRHLDHATVRVEARRLAGRLQNHGVGPGQLVAVLLDRGWKQVVATLAVLHAGGAYLPLDPDWPAERVARVLQRAGAGLVLVESERVALPEGVARLVVDAAAVGAGGPALRPVDLAETDVAYVIYTSGSTGTPKGVTIDHRGAVNTLLDVNARFGVGPADRVLAVSALSFDLSVFDIFGALAAGAAVVTLDPELARDPAHWREVAHAHRVSVWNSVPALAGMLLDDADAGHPLPASLRLAMLSGDWIPLTLPDRLRKALPGIRVESLGGATEASIWSIHHPVDEVDPAWRSIPYGRALAHQGVHVLDEALRPRPTWATGDLWISGAGLARGYWRDEAATAASFVVHPVSGERLYRTGDLGRLRPDGTIEFLGREDGQVKVHGYRIELGEIEAALEGHPGVRAAALRLLGQAQGEKRLAAYVVADGPAPEPAALVAYLEQRLPAYMVPSSFTVLDALPLSANGKVDRGQLPDPKPSPETVAEAPVLTDPAEQRLVEIVAEILDLPVVAPDANLLLLGATSIDIVRITNALSGALGFRPKLARLMRQPTLTDLLRMFREHTAERAVVATAQRAATVVEDPAARAAFTSDGRGRRGFAPDTPAVALTAPADPAYDRRYTGYRTVRRFAADPLPAEALGGLLATLAQREVDGRAKFQYGSAGGTYAVQTYVLVKAGRIDGVPGGAYYHDPATHRLLALGHDRELSPDAFDYFVNRPVFEAAAFALFLVAQRAAIEPLYQEQSATFTAIEAGAMAQLLTMAAPEHGLGLCGVGALDTAELPALFDLEPSHRLVYALLGGGRPGAEPAEPDAATTDTITVEL